MESSSQRCRKGTLTRTPEMAARLLRAVVEERGDRISGRALFSLYSQFKPPHPVDVVRILMRAWFFRRIHRRVGYYARDYLCGWPSEHTWLHWMTQGRLPEVMHVLRLSNDDIDQALVAEIEAMAAERKRQAENLDISDDWFIWIIEAAR